MKGYSNEVGTVPRPRLTLKTLGGQHPYWAHFIGGEPRDQGGVQPAPGSDLGRLVVPESGLFTQSPSVLYLSSRQGTTAVHQLWTSH